jgi:hypothetical protein
MPPRKSNVSAVSNNDSAPAPAPAPKPSKDKDDGINIEVCASASTSNYSPHIANINTTGPQPPQINSPTSRKGCPTSKYTDPERCVTSHVEECYCVCQLPHIYVRTLPPNPPSLYHPEADNTHLVPPNMQPEQARKPSCQKTSSTRCTS